MCFHTIQITDRTVLTKHKFNFMIHRAIQKLGEDNQLRKD